MNTYYKILDKFGIFNNNTQSFQPLEHRILVDHKIGKQYGFENLSHRLTNAEERKLIITIMTNNTLNPNESLNIGDFILKREEK